MYLKLEKCEFEKKKVNFLGLVIGDSQVTMDPAKVEAFCNFYRNFILRFAHITKPFNRLTEKNVVFHWGLDQQKAFADLRDAVCDDVTLLLPQDRALFRLETDAFEYPAGGVLHQIINGKPRLLGFFSKASTPRSATTENTSGLLAQRAVFGSNTPVAG